jgi:hypothetical protein
MSVNLMIYFEMIYIFQTHYVIHSDYILEMIAAFEPGSLAVAIYLLQSNILPLRKRPIYSCRKLKRFIKKNKHTLLDIAMEEMADPSLDLVNFFTHQYHDIAKQVVHLGPAGTLPLLLYFIVLFITILV